MNELERIRDEYARRARDGRYAQWYSTFNPAEVFFLQERERALLRLLHDYLPSERSTLRTLDVGCGHGHLLSQFVTYGFRRAGLIGIDFLPERLERARKSYPALTFARANAAALPFADASFGLVLQFTVFTSVLDDAMRRALASEMLRVLKPDGFIVWYDHRWNPVNHQVRGIGAAEIRRLFPDCQYDVRRVTLAPPLTRRIVPRSWLLGAFLSAMPLLRTHYLAAIRKQP